MVSTPLFLPSDDRSHSRDDVEGLEPWADSTLVMLPYLVSKLAIAAAMVYMQYLYGVVGGPTLSAEAPSFAWIIFLNGPIMGGLRAASIRIRSGGEAPPSASSRRRGVVPLLRSLFVHENSSHHVHSDLDDAAGVNVETTAATEDEVHRCHHPEVDAVEEASRLVEQLLFPVAVYGVLAFLATLFLGPLYDRGTNASVQFTEYTKPLAFAMYPTVMLYALEQVLLGLGLTGWVFVAGAVFYALPMALISRWTYLAWGDRGFGFAFAVSAWMGLVGLEVVLLAIRSPCSMWRSAVRVVRTRRSADGFSSWRCLLLPPAAVLRLAAPLMAVDFIGLLQNLIVARFVNGMAESASEAFSAGTTYFQSASTVVLAVSTCAGAVSASSGAFPTPTSPALEGVWQSMVRRLRLLLFGGASATTGVLVAGVVVALGLPPLAAARPIVQFFATAQEADPSVVDAAVRCARIASVGFVLSNVAAAVGGYLNGSGRVHLTLAATAVAGAATMGSVTVLGGHHSLHPEGVCILTASVSGALVAGLIGLSLWTKRTLALAEAEEM